METGVTNPSQLLLRWDGSVVQWGSVYEAEDGSQVWSYGSREIRRHNMLSEVVRFLNSRFKNVDNINYTRRYLSATMIPSIVVESNLKVAENWYNLQNAPSEEVALRIQHLDSIDTQPVIIESGDAVWEEVVTNFFPQASRISQQASLLKAAVASSKKISKMAVYVDAGSKGADIVSAKAGVPFYVGAISSDLTDSMLYNIVNAMHRDGFKPRDVSVHLMGERAEELSESMKRFFEEVEIIGGDDYSWFGLKIISE
ncbi:MAG: hypothetical protein CL847_07170 [Crocinitomicaceae bacterium]|nr:hypothetical protein [Crocinitomicaceae bacterium]|tara:strand:+ start:2338 stop:3105 length:768 start_codon:yes stop_codon:yes gene_type:complete